MADPELKQLRERIQALHGELERHKHDAQFRETSEANIHLFARGLAHDFNNLLTGILGHASLIQTAPDVSAEYQEAAGVIYKAAERASELVGQLMHFTRGGMSRSLPVDIHATIHEVADLLKRSLDPSIRLDLRLLASNAMVTGDPGQVHQMLLNLALNARDAMPAGGRLTFETADHLGPGRAGGPTGSGIVVLVRDTGQGIPEEIRESIFEPFFTTKAQGRGSGMGLAIVRRVVHNHRGSIQVNSEPGRGAEFRIVLPSRRAL